ncbi:CRTAC1 family protein [Pelagicoccus sp. SDUM812005]|uniref:CRTAC1 family protein n=1 Tax=Pelagicoccus sp. SDUM812005 TaxID=3041257 RepID=UPI00280CB46E|nr:CRTAC1 family protein [Pelagicoccus sp. SDUM812005]MDQ8183095.1 CRTAC1 family protein [Pelagicoccus sp. SDUM812005]
MAPLLKGFAPAALALIAVAVAPTQATAREWERATASAGLDGIEASRLKFVDLNQDRRPDAVILPDNSASAPRIFLNLARPKSPLGFRYIEKTDTGLPLLSKADIIAFADIDNDGKQDALIGRNLDIYQSNYAPPAEAPKTSAWLPGKGDGSFGAPIPIPAASLATTCSIAVGDVNEDGLPDLFIGNWYERYFSGYEAFANDLLLQYRPPAGSPAFVRWPLPNETAPTDYTTDLGGRPTYGTAFARLDDGLPMLVELNYGRRWNRLYKMDTRKPLRELKDYPATPFILQEPKALAAHLVRHLKGRDIAAEAGVDGDAIRHGRHQKWPLELANDKPRSLRPDEPPFRANGNTFDVAVGDIDNDGDFDLFVSTIFHAWAGDSSDRSRFLVNQFADSGTVAFQESERLSVDRLPEPPGPGEKWQYHHVRQNQGDIFAELADLDQDGRLDLILCSSDYADEAPYEERLRIFLQQPDGSFADRTAQLGIDHIGAGMPSLADVDLDGDLDLLVGQSFNRLTQDQRQAASVASGALPPNHPADAAPERRASLFLNPASEQNHSITFTLVGSPEDNVSRDAYGAIVRLTADLDGDPSTPEVTQARQLLGPGGHAGKQHPLLIHFGLGRATHASAVEIVWPNPQRETTRLTQLAPGHHEITYP